MVFRLRQQNLFYIYKYKENYFEILKFCFYRKNKPLKCETEWILEGSTQWCISKSLFARQTITSTLGEKNIKDYATEADIHYYLCAFVKLSP